MPFSKLRLPAYSKQKQALEPMSLKSLTFGMIELWKNKTEYCHHPDTSTKKLLLSLE